MSVNKFHQIQSSCKAIILSDFTAMTVIFTLGCYLHNNYYPSVIYSLDNYEIGLHWLLFIIATHISLLGVGLYNDKTRETFKGIELRIIASIAISYCIVSLSYWFTPLDPFIYNFKEMLFFSAIIALTATRFFALYFNYESLGKRRVLILGAGERASIIEKRMRRKADRVGFEIVGFVRMPGDSDNGIKSENTIELNEPLEEFSIKNNILEIVIAADERRNNISVDSLFYCKIHGIEITEIIDFIEKESGQIAVNLIYPSWVIYSNGFHPSNYIYSYINWFLNSLLACSIFLVTWPLMLLAIIMIKIEDGIRAPILYSQERVGLNGFPFVIYKFRSMRLDAEKEGAKWATKNDSRITRVGNFLRKYRVDELPQLYNVIKGDMGFVGPRPERPQFTKNLVMSVPFYNHRHNVKPGLTGWAQLKYPYGSNEQDALEKLKFDLYYIKHRSFLLDLLILVRTSEIILFGKGR